MAEIIIFLGAAALCAVVALADYFVRTGHPAIDGRRPTLTRSIAHLREWAVQSSILGGHKMPRTDSVRGISLYNVLDAISFVMLLAKLFKEIVSAFFDFRERTATVPSCCSFSPTTRM